MFFELIQLINSNSHYAISDEVEILKGWYNKPKTLKERINKKIRKIMCDGKRRT